ncbi:MAG TPA: alpha/beta hydrolase, partial [Planctomycetes bacterium]|nr:alpha/beta hydrolase [Planctomycetota bacterium]
FLVLTYDLRGQGRSVFPSVKYSNHNDLVELLSGLGAQNVTLVGLSAGAQVALDVALAEPVLVERMVLVSPSIAGYVPEEMPAFLSELMGFLREKDFDQANEVLLSSSIMSVPPEQVERVREMVEVNDRLWSIPYSLVEQSPVSALERLEEIKMPTLVLVGENDLEAIRTQGALLENRMPNAHKISIAGGGHLLNLTSPQLFREALAKFLKISRE